MISHRLVYHSRLSNECLVLCKGGYVFLSVLFVCLSVCLSVSKIIPKVMNRLKCNFIKGSGVPYRYIFVSQ